MAAERSRASRARAAQRAIVDAAIVDGLDAALARLTPGMGVREIVTLVARSAADALKEAGIEKPGATFKARLKRVQAR
jgi:hypothetical protein